MYWCVICKEWFNKEPHTDEETGEDCHAKCCITCKVGNA